MLYYTPVYFNTVHERGYGRSKGKPSSAYPLLRAVAFVDTEKALRDATWASAVVAAQAFFSAARDSSGAAFPVMAAHVVSDVVSAWVFTAGFHAYSAKQWDPHTQLRILDDLYGGHPARDINLEGLFDKCTKLIRLAGGCPCPSAALSATDIYKQRDYSTRECGATYVWPRIKQQPYLAAAAENARSREGFPEKAFPTKCGDYQYLSARMLYQDFYAHTVLRLEELCVPDMDAIHGFCADLSANASSAAVTRNIRRTQCAACVFDRCDSSYGTNNCDGAKTLQDIARYNDKTADLPPDAYTGFTTQQRDLLMCNGGNRVFMAVGFQGSDRARKVCLGYFTYKGKFRVFSGAQKTREDYQDVDSWEKLVELIPELADPDTLYPPAVAMTEDLRRKYHIVASNEHMTFKAGWGEVTRALLYVSFSRGGFHENVPNVVWEYNQRWTAGVLRCDETFDRKYYIYAHGTQSAWQIPPKIG